MQPGLFIEVLVLQSERLMCVLVNPLIFFQTTPGGVFAVPQKIAVDVGHLAQDADVVGVEIGEVLRFVLVVAAFTPPFGRFVGKDVVGGVEGECFAAAGLAVSGFLNASDFVVDVMELLLWSALWIRLPALS